MRQKTPRWRQVLLALGAVFTIVSSSSLATAAHAAAGSAFVRVNQVGYAAADSKRAYLLASAVETGATFSVKSGSTTVFSSPIGANLGSWSSSYPNVYALDFSSVATPGTYSIAVTGPIAATSPSFKIDIGQTVYAQALSNSLSFYQVQRDGPSFIPSALRTAPAHLNDQAAMTYLTPSYNAGSGRFSGDLSPLGVTIDASGGWFDAGDYLKFVMTTSYTEDLLLAGVRDFPSLMGSGSATSNFAPEAKFGVQWLLKMWNDSTSTLYYQVGIGTGNAHTLGDHDIWRLPQADDAYQGTNSVYRYIRNRPVFRAGAPGSLISPNLAGRDAAAFAECFVVFKTSDPALASQCLTAGEHIFDLANTSPSGNLLTAIPFSFYPETEWRDDLELGATELYFATASGGLPTGLPHTDPTFYLQNAATWANAYITGPNDAADTLNLYDVTGLAHYELYRAITQAGNPSGLAVTQTQLLTDLKKQLDKAVTQGGTDPFGFGFPWNVYDTTSHGAGLSVEASEYDQLTGTTTYADYADRWLANILGANAWGLSLIVGDGTTFPDCLQHQVANLAGNLSGGSPVLVGAAVEGPNGGATKGAISGMIACPTNGVDVYGQFNGHGAQFLDNMQSYSNTEPAIDLTASSPLAFARQAGPATAAASPTVVSIQFDDGNANQYTSLAILNTYKMQATFYVNSGMIGDSTHMSWSQLTALATAGNEIAGHTIFHTDIKKLKTAAARQAVCGDRVNLFNQGFQPVSFAYPFGSFDAASEAVVQACGFNSGRGVSGVDDRKVFAETVPPPDAYATRTPPNPKQGTTVATIEGYVTAAQTHGGGWVQLVFHNICSGCDAYSITQADFTTLLAWLQSQGPNGISVETTAQVIGGPVQPVVQP